MKMHSSVCAVCGVVLICMRPLSRMVIRSKKEHKALEEGAVMKCQ